MSEFKIAFSSTEADAKVANLIKQVEMLGAKMDAVNAKSLDPKVTQATATSAASLKKEMSEILSASNIRQAQLLGHQFESVNKAIQEVNSNTGRLIDALSKNKKIAKEMASESDKTAKKEVANSKAIAQQLNAEATVRQRMAALASTSRLVAVGREPSIFAKDVLNRQRISEERRAVVEAEKNANLAKTMPGAYSRMADTQNLTSADSSARKSQLKAIKAEIEDRYAYQTAQEKKLNDLAIGHVKKWMAEDKKATQSAAKERAAQRDAEQKSVADYYLGMQSKHKSQVKAQETTDRAAKAERKKQLDAEQKSVADYYLSLQKQHTAKVKQEKAAELQSDKDRKKLRDAEQKSVADFYLGMDKKHKARLKEQVAAEKSAAMQVAKQWKAVNKEIESDRRRSTPFIYQQAASNLPLSTTRAQASLSAAEGNTSGLRAQIAAEERLKALKKQIREEEQKNLGVFKESASAQKKHANSQKSFVDSLHSGRQATAAWRAGLNAAGASLGIFTSSTIITATAVYSLVAAYKQSIVAGVQFTDMMARVQAVTSATADEAERMSTQARAVAASTIFTAREAADAMLQLGMSGMSVEQTMTALEPTLRLASIGMMSAGEAADIATNTMNQFGLSAGQITQVVDDLATAANNANTTVSQVGNALSYVGPAAAAANVPIETAIASIQVLANAGIKASRAGTGLRRVISNFSGPTKKTADALWELGIATKDSAGNLRPLEEILKDLASANIGVAQATDLVGVRQQAALLALVKSAKGLEDGSTSLENFKKQLENNGDAAKDFQKTIEDTLGADFKLLMSAAEEQAIAFFETNEAGYRDLIQSTTQFVRSLDVDSIKAFTDGVYELGKGGLLLIATAGVWKLTTAVGSLIPMQAAATASTTAHGAAMASTAASTTVLTGAIGRLNAMVVASAAFMRAHPIGLFITALAGGYAAYKLYFDNTDKIVNSFDTQAAAAYRTADSLTAVKEAMESLSTAPTGLARIHSAQTAAAPGMDPVSVTRATIARLQSERDKLAADIEAQRGEGSSPALDQMKAKLNLYEENINRLKAMQLEVEKASGVSGKIEADRELSTGNLNEKSRQKWADWLSAEMKKSSSELVANAREVANTLIEKTDEAEARGTLSATAAHKKRMMLLDETRKKIDTIYSGESGSVTTLEAQIKAQEEKIGSFEKQGLQVEGFQYEELFELKKKLYEEELQQEKDLQEESRKSQKERTDYISSYIKGMQQIEKKARSAYVSAANSASKLAEKNQIILASNRDLASVGFVTARTRSMENKAEIEAIRVKADLTDAKRTALEATISEVAADEGALKARQKAIAALKQEAEAYRSLANAKENQPISLTDTRKNLTFSESMFGGGLTASDVGPFEQVSRKYAQLRDEEQEYYESKVKNINSTAGEYKFSVGELSRAGDEHKAVLDKLKIDETLDQIGVGAGLASQMLSPWQQYFSNVQSAHQEHNSILIQQRKELVAEMKEVEKQDYTAQIVRMRELGATRTEIADSIKATEEERAQTMKSQKAELSALDQQIDAQHKAFESAKSYSVAMAKLQIPLVFAQGLASAPAPFNIPIAIGMAALAHQQVSQIEGTSLPRRQFGGNVQMGQPTVTNEAGPELFVPDKSGTIIPSDKLYRALQMAQTEAGNSANAGGDTYVIEMNINAMDSKSILDHKDTITDMVVSGIDKKRRSRGKGTVIGA